MLQEFKEFISKGNVVVIAVGLIMALFFAEIVNALLDGVIMPIISAIFGEPSFERIGFDLGDARVSIGLVIIAVIMFVVVAFILFLMIKAYNRMVKSPEAGPSEIDLLTEIRDELRSR